MAMTASRVTRSLLRAAPAVLFAVVAAATFTAVGGVATAQAPLGGLPPALGIPGPAHHLQILPGQNSTGASGSVIPGKNDAYSISTAPGQSLAFDVVSSNGGAVLTVAPLVGPMVAQEVPHADVVADGHDYQIAVSTPDGASDYTLTVTAY
ncbi:hypothetical protein NRB56_36820 [Nocardia sp. RB56]|uniref:Uncharacterized protein n=2 Tax=Nocardia aurantia TaxID=2585199 RepID=A0A7K0DQR6_9NOCA|nr:hypothetical protein [Nocardia aurantia]